MFISQIFESSTNKILVIYPGRFQPATKGHRAVYDYLCKKFGYSNVYIATSDKVAPPKSPFNFEEKRSLMTLAGIDPLKVIRVSDPYRATEITSHFDPEKTILLFAVSEKDMIEDPRFKSWTKKDKTPTYFQPAPKDINECQTFDSHGYVLTVPTFNFNVLGKPMRSASEFRSMFAKSDEHNKKKLIKDLFGNYSDKALNIMSSKITESSIKTVTIQLNEALETHSINSGDYQKMPNWELIGYWHTFSKLKNSPIDLIQDIRQSLLDEIKRRHLESETYDQLSEDDLDEDWQDSVLKSMRTIGTAGAMGLAALSSSPSHLNNQQLLQQYYKLVAQRRRGDNKTPKAFKNNKAILSTVDEDIFDINEDIIKNAEDPLNPTITGIGNSISLNGAKISAYKQIEDLYSQLSALKNKNNFDAWDVITKQFSELKRNIERIKHGQEELQKLKNFKKNKNLSESYVTKNDLNQLELYLDKLYNKIGLDVSFTKHFLERCNDPRNKKPITISELIRLFKQEYNKWGRKIAQLGPDAEAVMKDMKTDVNVPFALNWNSKHQDIDLVAKTVMRKPNFTTSNPEFPID